MENYSVLIICNYLEVTPPEKDEVLTCSGFLCFNTLDLVEVDGELYCKKCLKNKLEDEKDSE